MKSIITDKRVCFICGATQGIQTHHVLDGIRRKKADQEGLTIPLCYRCHMALHDKGKVTVFGKTTDERYLKQQAQMAWMFHNRLDEDAFRERFGKSYI